MLQRLPLGLHTFSKIRAGNFLYVDKTEYVYKLITGSGCRYFLSRPRRFGKSLLVSTLKEALEGKKELFDNLWISKSDYQWKKHAIIMLDLSLIDSGQTAEIFLSEFSRKLIEIAENHSVFLAPLGSISGMLDFLYTRIT